CLAWAAYSDPYYAIYGLLLAACLVAARTIAIVPLESVRGARRGIRLVDGALVVMAAGTLALGVLGGGELRLGTLTVTSRTLHTPMLLLTVLVIARVLLTIRPRVRVVDRAAIARAMSVCSIIALAGGVLVLPVVIE